MARLLVTNDDGLDSPLLIPLARALADLGEVRVVVPESERSWIGKAISRFDTVHVRGLELDGVAVQAVSGTPADCVAIAIGELMPRPDLVISGINLGLNFGSGFFLSSGTVGGVLEAWIAGVAGIAFSMAIPSDAFGLTGAARRERVGTRSTTAAEVARDITAVLLDEGFPAEADLFSVNFPADVDPSTPRRVTRMTRARYGPIFSPAPEGGYLHRFQWYRALIDEADGDIAAVNRGEVAITPVRLDFSTELPESLRRRLESRPGAPIVRRAGISRNTPARGG